MKSMEYLEKANRSSSKSEIGKPFESLQHLELVGEIYSLNFRINLLGNLLYRNDNRLLSF